MEPPDPSTNGQQHLSLEDFARTAGGRPVVSVARDISQLRPTDRLQVLCLVAAEVLQLRPDLLGRLLRPAPAAEATDPPGPLKLHRPDPPEPREGG